MKMDLIATNNTIIWTQFVYIAYQVMPFIAFGAILVLLFKIIRYA